MNDSEHIDRGVSDAFDAKLEEVSALFREALLESECIDEEDFDGGKVDAAIQDFADGILTVPGDEKQNAE